MRAALVPILLLLCFGGGASAQRPKAGERRIIKSTYAEISFPKAIKRVAVADESIAKVLELSERELLVLGVEVGRTMVIVWLEGGAHQRIDLAVERDLSVLREALLDIDPSIEVSVAPDRDAVVLRGNVADVTVSRAAEAAARSYLSADKGNGGSSTRPVVRVPGAEQNEQPGEDRVRNPTTPAGNSAVINLILVERLPRRADERMKASLQALGCRDLQVRRLQQGELPDDAVDVFLLEGSVPDQRTLTRALLVASRTLLGQNGDRAQVRVVADESGGVRNSGQNGANSGNRGGGGGTQGGGLGGGLGSGSGTQNLRNRLDTNIGRASALEIANGRILSFLRVEDLPQVSISAKIYEVNRTRIRNLGANLGVLTADFDQPPLLSSGTAQAFQGSDAARVSGAGGTDVQNVLGFFQGAFSNQFQLATSGFALDAAFSVLESKNLARKLSEPTLCVLNGEAATFQVGGQIPVPQAFAPDTGQGLAQGVFSSVEFVPFGVQLTVRALVGENDHITLDLFPQVVNPDPALTLLIQGSTGSSTATTAFENRSIRTTNRVRDGEALMVGGLINRIRRRELAETPGLRDIPGLEWLFRDFAGSDDEIELVVVVTPRILREARPKVALWRFPDATELLELRGQKKSPASPEARESK